MLDIYSKVDEVIFTNMFVDNFTDFVLGIEKEFCLLMITYNV